MICNSSFSTPPRNLLPYEITYNRPKPIPDSLWINRGNSPHEAYGYSFSHPTHPPPINRGNTRAAQPIGRSYSTPYRKAPQVPRQPVDLSHPPYKQRRHRCRANSRPRQGRRRCPQPWYQRIIPRRSRVAATPLRRLTDNPAACVSVLRQKFLLAMAPAGQRFKPSRYKNTEYTIKHLV